MPPTTPPATNSPQELTSENGTNEFYRDVSEICPYGFTFIWDSWDDKVMIPKFSNDVNHEGAVLGPLDWMNILDVSQSVNRAQSGSEAFILCYQLVHSDPEIFQCLKIQKGPLDSGTLADTLQTEAVDIDNEVLEGLECVICGQQIAIQFQSCTHAACKSCVEQLWRGKIQHARQFPEWFPCPLCRRQVTQLGVLSPEQQVLGFGEGVQHGDFRFTIWSWQRVRRWMALNFKDVELGLKTLQMEEERYFAIRLDNTLNVSVEAVISTHGLRSVKAPDRILGWAWFIVFSFITLAIEGRDRHWIR